MYDEPKAAPEMTPIRAANIFMADRLSAICNKVIHTFKNDIWMTPLRLNRDLKYGKGGGDVGSPSVCNSAVNEVPLPPLNWHTEMICPRESTADSMKLAAVQAPKLIRKDPGFNFLD